MTLPCFAIVATAALTAVMSLPLSLRAAILVLDDGESRVPLGGHIDILEDREKEWGIDDVSSGPASDRFAPADAAVPNLGYTGSAWWVRFRVDDRSTRRWVLQIDYPLIDSVRLFTPDGGGGFAVKEGGRLRPFAERDIITRSHVFDFTASGEGARTCYLRLESEDSLAVPLILWEYRAFLAAEHREQLYLGFYYGLIAVMVLFNLFVFFSTRDVNYLWYVLAITTLFGLFQLALNGLTFEAFSTDSLFWSRTSIAVFFSLGILCTVQFCRSFLETGTHIPLLNKIMLGIMAWAAVTAAAQFFVPYRYGIQAAVLMGQFGAGSVWLATFLALLRRERAARFFMLAWSLVLVGGSTYSLKVWGLVPSNFFTEYTWQIGSAVETVLLSIALADQIQGMRVSLVRLNADLEKSEKTARDRADFLQDLIESSRAIVGTFTDLSTKLIEIVNQLFLLSEEQAANTEEMSATFEELVSSNDQIHQAMVRQQKEGAVTRDMVVELSGEQEAIMREGSGVMESVASISESTGLTEDNLRRMFDRMSIVNAGGAEISRFVGMIHDISDRINLLSLNASIEAARAGEHGRGFAVVAEEIGKLAAATADNSKQIAEKISSIIIDIEEGTGIVNATRDSTERVFALVARVRTGIESVGTLLQRQVKTLSRVREQAEAADSLSQGIVSATSEQNLSMGHTMKATERLSEMAQEIASLNQRILGFAKTINEKSIELLTHVNREV